MNIFIIKEKMILSAKRVARGVRPSPSLLRTIPLRASANQVEIFVDGKAVKVCEESD